MSLSQVAKRFRERDRGTDRLDIPIELYPIILLATLLRIFRLEAESYWLDEAFSVNLVSSTPLSELLFHMPGNEPHPPLYNVLLYGWTTIFGTTELATRTLSGLFGIATVIVLYGIGRWLFTRQVGAIAAVLVAVSPFHVRYAQETRMYSLLALLTALSFYWFFRITVNHRTETTVTRATAGYVLSTVLLGYTHVFGLFLILVQTVYIVSQPLIQSVPRSRLSMRRWIALESITAILLVPWLLRLSRRVMAASRGEAGNVSWIPTPTAETIRETLAAYIGGYLFEESLPILLSLLVAGCLVVALSSTNRQTSETGRQDSAVNGLYLVILWLVLPILVPVLISYVISPIFLPRYSIGASLAFLLLIARGVQMFSWSSLQYGILGLLLVGIMLPLPTYYETDQKEQWREAATQVESNVDSDDVVLISKPWTKTPFEYYFDRLGVPIVQLNPDASANQIRNYIEGRDDVWIVLSYTGDAAEQRIRQAVKKHPEYRGPVDANEYIGIGVYRFEHVNRSGSSGSRRLRRLVITEDRRSSERPRGLSVDSRSIRARRKECNRHSRSASLT